MPEKVQFRLLGQVEVVRAGVPTSVGGPRDRALLALLLVCPAGLAASEIADRLWRGAPPPGVTNTLQGYVSRVRRALGPTGRDLLVTRRPGYVLDVSASDVDARRVEQNAAEAMAALNRGDRLGALAAVDAALGEWRGEALEEFAEEGWTHDVRTRLAELRGRLVDLRADVQLDLGHGVDLVADVAASVTAAPLNEHRAAQLMVVLHRAGRQAEALETYSRLRRRLGEELGIVPGAEVERIHDAIVCQDGSLDGSAWRGPVAVALGATAPAAGPDSFGALPFVGRGRERARLVEACEGAVVGRGGVVVVRGEPGVGKTALVEQVTAALGGRVRVLRGRGVEGDAVLPHWLWSQALEPIVDAAALGADPTLFRLWPHLATRLPAPEDAAVERARLDDAVVRLLAAASQECPLVVVLDDLQWADAGSLRCVRHVVQRTTRLPITVVAILRSTDVGDDLRRTVARIVREPRTHLIDLGGLGPEDLDLYLRRTVGAATPDDVATLHGRTGGNAFFVESVVRQARDGADGDGPGVAWVHGLPTTALEVVEDRCHGLGPDGADVLEVAAVIGRSIDIRVVADAAGRPVARVQGVFEGASRRGLLVPEPVGGRFQFSHDLVREAIAARVRSSHRSALHRRIASALEAERSRGGAVESAALAVHLRAAAADGTGVAEAVEASLAAAHEATAVLAFDEALGLLEAVEHLSTGSGGFGDLRLRLLLALGHVRWLAGAAAAARRTYLEAAEAAVSTGDDEGLADAMLGFGGGFIRDWHATRGVHGERVGALLEAAVARAPRDDLRRSRLLSLWAEEHYFDRDPGPRLAASADAVALARATGDDVVLAACLAGRAASTWGPDTETERDQATHELVRVAARLADPEPSLCALHHRFTTEVGRGRMLEARRTWDDYASRADEARSPLHRWQAACLNALLALVDGDLGVSEDRIDVALALGSETDDPDVLGVWGSQIAMVRYEQGRLGELSEPLRALAQDMVVEGPIWRAAVCFVDVEMGELDAARSGLDRLAIDDFAVFPRDFTYLASLSMLADVAARLDDRERAADLHRLLLPYEDRHVLTGDRHTWGSARLHLALLEATLGAPAAEDRFAAAAAHNQDLDAQSWLAHTWAEHAAYLVQRGSQGDATRARELAERAGELAAVLGLVRVRQTLAIVTG